MRNSTPCKIVTPENFNLKLCTPAYVGETTHHANFGLNRYSVGFSPNRRNITTLCVTFYCAAWNADAIQRWEFCLSVSLSVRLSIRRSNTWIVAKRKNDLSGFSYCTKNHIAWFSEKKNGWWGWPFYLKYWVKLTPLERNRQFSSIFAHSASAVAPGEKCSTNTNRKSTMCFPIKSKQK